MLGLAQRVMTRREGGKLGGKSECFSFPSHTPRNCLYFLEAKLSSVIGFFGEHQQLP